MILWWWQTERKLCQLVTEFGRVCERRKFRVNVGKSKVMRCIRNEDGARLNVNVEWRGRSRPVQILRLSYSCKWWSGSRCAS